MCLPAIIVGTVTLVTFLTVLGRIDKALGPLMTFVGGILSATVATPPLLAMQEKGIFALLILVVTLSILLGHWEGRLIFKRAALSFFGFSFFAGMMSVMNRFDPSTIEPLLVFGEATVDFLHTLGFDCHFFDKILPH